MPRYPVIYAKTKDGWSEWIFPARRYQMACCDCGLVHEIEFRVIKVRPSRVKIGKKRVTAHTVVKTGPAGCRVELRCRRNERATSQIRRRRHRNG